jgi:hypothetical protein
MADDTTPDVDDDTMDDAAPEPEPEAWVAPTEAEHKRMIASLEKANAQAAKLRKEKQEQAAKQAADAGQAPDLDQVRRETADRFKAPMVRAHLVAAGVPAASAARVARMLDLAAVDVTDDGSIDGLDDQIDQLRTEVPALFAVTEEKALPRKAPSGDTKRGAPVGAKAPTMAEQLAKALTGG